ncbi:MAG: transposase [Bradymonadaceae bacterium]
MDSIRSLVQIFCPAFTAPSFSNACFLLLSWIKTSGRARISEFLRVRRFMPKVVPRRTSGKWKHYSVLYRFFSEARWTLDELGKCLVGALAGALPEDNELVLMIDDTFQKRSGPRILGAGMHYDGSESTYSGAQGAHPRIDFGLSFVVLAVWVPIDWVEAGGLAIPVMFRLYRPRKQTPEDKYRKRTELAVQMLDIGIEWFENDQMVVAVDNEYSCETVLEGRPESVDVVGRLQGRNVVYDPEFEQKKRGRSRMWGPRLGRLDELAESDRFPWQMRQVQLYGDSVELKIKRLEVQWKSAPASATLTVVITRDPKGHLDDGYFFRTREGATIEDVLVPAARRWGIEMCFRNCKQHMRISSVQNGFAQGDEPNDPNEPGPDAPEGREPTASRRTVPFGMIAYGFVVLWYLKHGNPETDLKRAKLLAPWYTQKDGISFRDMLEAFRRQMEIEQLWQTPDEGGFGKKIDRSGPIRNRRSHKNAKL